MGRRRLTPKERAVSLTRTRLKRKNKINVLTRNVLVEKNLEKIIFICNDNIYNVYDISSMFWWYQEQDDQKFKVRELNNETDYEKQTGLYCDFDYTEVYIIVEGERRGFLIHKSHCKTESKFKDLWKNYL
jgi:hypothetical protein